MELDPNDYDIVKLLTKLKNSNGAYPPELLTSRRQNYLRRVSEIGLGLGVADGFKTTAKSGGKAGASSSITAGGLIEAALVAIIIAEAGATAYLYRDRIAQIIRSYTSQPQVVEVTFTAAPDFSPKIPNVVIQEPDEPSATPVVSVTPSGTPIAPAPTSAANDNPENQGSQSVGTPDPNGNSGNHFGQTPKPDRTREPGGGGNNNNNNDNGRNR